MVLRCYFCNIRVLLQLLHVTTPAYEAKDGIRRLYSSLGIGAACGSVGEGYL